MLCEFLAQPHSVLRIPAATNQIPSSGIWALTLSPLPDRNGRKLVVDWGGTTRGSFRIGGRIHSCGECKFIPPHQSLVATASPQGEAFLRESFRTTQQGDKRERYCPPSYVAYGVKLLAVFFPLEGEAFLRESFRTTRQGDKRERYCPPSYVAYSVKLLAVFFPLEGEGYGA